MKYKNTRSSGKTLVVAPLWLSNISLTDDGSY